MTTIVIQKREKKERTGHSMFSRKNRNSLEREENKKERKKEKKAFTYSSYCNR
jgi:hypothetical protein